MTTKNILIGSLTISILALTGCSGLQDAINNKIAETTKQVADGVNSEVGKATDALKQQGETIQKDTEIAAAQLKSEFGIVDGEVYKNTEFGFSLQFPKSWGKLTIKGPIDTKLVSNTAKSVQITSENKAKTYNLIIVDKTFIEDDGLERNAVLGKTLKGHTVFGELYDTTGFEGGFVNKEVKAINESFKAL